MLNPRRAIIGGAAAAVLAAPLSTAPVFAEAPKDTKLQVLGITDFHGRIADPIGKETAATIENQRDGVENSVLLSAGDNIGASTYVSSSQKDEPTIDYLNALGLDASAMGNHEYDRGWDDFSARVLRGEDSAKKADFPHLAANVYKKGTTEYPEGVKDYTIVEKNGIKIAVIGVVTQETASLVSPAGISGLEFGDTASAVKKASEKVAALKGDDAPDVTIVQAHVGMTGAAEGDSCSDAFTKSSEVKNILDSADDSVDAFFLGHTHVPVNCTYKKGDNTVAVMQAGQYGENVASLSLVSKGDGNWDIEKQEIVSTKGKTASTSVTEKTDEIIDAATEKSIELGKEVAGEIDEDITRAFTDGKEDRGAESTLGNLVADALKYGSTLSNFDDADFGITNPGGLRTDLKVDDIFKDEKPGEVTVAELNQVLPFANDHGIVELKGADVIQLFEEQWQPEGSSRPFLHLGISKELKVVYDSSAERGKHVVSVKVNGKDIDPEKTYRVATLSFLAAGGDNFTSFANGEFQQTGLTDFEVWEAYFNSFQDEGKKVSPDKNERQADAALDVLNNGDLTVDIQHPVGKDGTTFELEEGKSAKVTVHFEAKKDIDGPLRMTFDLPKGVSIELGEQAVDGKPGVAEFGKIPQGESDVEFTVTAKKGSAAKDSAELAASIIASEDAQWWDNNPMPVGGTVDFPMQVIPADSGSDDSGSNDVSVGGTDTGSDDDKPQPGSDTSDDNSDTGAAGSKNPLPRTGTEVAIAMAAAIALLVVGTITVVMSRRRYTANR